MAWPVVFIVVMVCDLIIPYILAPFYKGYSHRKMVMSCLGSTVSSVRHLYNSWLLLGGIAFLWCSIKMFMSGTIRNGLTVGTFILMLVYAIGGMVLSGLFSVGPTKAIDTIPAKIHGFGATIGFMALLFVPLLLSIDAGRRQDTIALIVSATSFVFAFVTFVLFVMADKPQFKGTAIDNEGTWQRFTLLFMYTPIIYSCLCVIL